jgi:hypothetical protein
MKHDQKGFAHVGLLLLVVVVVGAVGFTGYTLYKKKNPAHPKVASDSKQYASDPVSRGKYLSKDNCSGEGSKKLGSGPMRPADIGIIEPMGLVAGGHVTPVDHEYYYAKNQSAPKSTYDVLTPASGTLVTVEVRPKGAPGVYDVRGVISYSCTFFSYFDLANSLSDDVKAKMPSGWETKNGPQAVNVPVTEGQVIAKVGGQSLDYAVWDTTKTLQGLLVPDAYNNYEPWKINTVAPLDYYSTGAKTALLPFYVRSAAPRDGRIDYDVDGKAVGNWFKQGTNGYIGAFKEADFNPMSYADGHLSLAPDFLNPSSGWAFSIGSINHGTQYAIKNPSVVPDKLGASSGVVKYELASYEHLDETGAKWLGTRVPKSITLNTKGSTMATALVQMTGKRELKVQVFVGKTASQVDGFTDATTYTRGDEATTMMGPDQGQSKPKTP